ncbi:hypothetical protein L195_g062484, partial [Trifolium pratense]
EEQKETEQSKEGRRSEDLAVDVESDHHHSPPRMGTSTALTTASTSQFALSLSPDLRLFFLSLVGFAQLMVEINWH